MIRRTVIKRRRLFAAGGALLLAMIGPQMSWAAPGLLRRPEGGTTPPDAARFHGPRGRRDHARPPAPPIKSPIAPRPRRPPAPPRNWDRHRPTSIP